MRASKKVVFFFPGFASSEATAPLGILAIATPLLRVGYQAAVSAFLTVGFCRWEKPTVNHSTIDRGYR